MRHRLIVFLLLIIVFSACSYPDVSQVDFHIPENNYAAISQKEFSYPMFSSDSPFNSPVSSDYKIDKDSDVMIERLLNDIDNGADPVLSVNYWSVTAYFADESTSRYDVSLNNNWGLDYDYIVDVPIPHDAKPDPKGDGHLAVIDLSSGYVYEFWQFEGSGDNYSASWGNRISLNSTGIYPYGMSSRGSGFSSLLGMVWPQEFTNGQIEHALILSIPSTKSGGPVFPATESDGWTNRWGAIPIGAHIVLDPQINLDDYNLTEYERIIAECLQIYGAYVGDTSGSIEFEAINPLSFENDAYNNLFSDEWIFLNNIPFEHLQVTEMPNQSKNSPLYVTDTDIYK